jgi:Domain of unknown function (DUF305)
MQSRGEHDKGTAYRTFAIEMAIDVTIMYFVMYTMIDTVAHLYLNVNNVYMTLMMVAPMALLMLLPMRSMFRSKTWNMAIGVAAVVIFALSYAGMRTQAGVGDRQFLRSMIPHHSGAILMCQQASLTDPEIVALCRDIVESQRAEIAKMQALLARWAPLATRGLTAGKRFVATDQEARQLSCVCSEFAPHVLWRPQWHCRAGEFVAVRGEEAGRGCRTAVSSTTTPSGARFERPRSARSAQCPSRRRDRARSNRGAARARPRR